MDEGALLKNARECNNNVVAVEDHYCNAFAAVLSTVLRDVVYLCVRDIPRSGQPQELLQRYGIAATAIVKMVEKML